MADWPFRATKSVVRLTAPTTPEEQIAQAWYRKQLTWPNAMNQALVYYQQQEDWDNAARVAQNLAEAFHFLGNVQFIAGQLVSRIGQPALAASYLERAVALEDTGAHRVALASAYDTLERTDDAITTLEAVARDDPAWLAAQRALRQLR